MKIIMQFSDYGYKTHHNFALRIKELMPNCQFYIDVEPTNFVKKYLLGQQEIKYNFFSYPDFNPKEDEIDFELIREFEKDLPFKSMWRVVSTDRSLGRTFLHGFRGYPQKTFIDRILILKRFTYELRRVSKMFDQIKPDVYFPATAMGSIEVIISSVMCKKNKINYVVLNGLRFFNFCTYSPSYELNVPIIENYTKKLINNKNHNFSQSVEDLYSKLKSEINQDDFHEKKNIKLKINKLETTFDKVIYIFIKSPLAILKNLFLTMLRNFKNMINLNNKNQNISFFQFVAGIFTEPFQRYLFLKQAYKITNANFGKILNKDQKYVFFPLQVQPEYASNILAPMWVDSQNMVETIAKSIPSDWIVYVKEHPAMLSDRVRPKNFYEDLKKIPNVVFAPTYFKTFNIIKNSEMVIVQSNNSVAFDAIVLDKPVIEFRKNTWSLLELSKVSSDTEMLSKDIIEEIARIKNISKSEKERRIKCFIDSIHNFSFNLKYIKQAFYNEVGSDKEYKDCGKEMADFFIKYMKIIK